MFNKQCSSIGNNLSTVPSPHTHKELYALKKLCQNAADSFDFEIACMTSDQVTLECSAQLPLSPTFSKMKTTVGIRPWLIEGNSSETWQSSLSSVFVGYFGGLACTKPGKVQNVVKVC